MNTIDMVAIVRKNVTSARTAQRVKYAEQKVAWSTKASKQNYFVRWLFGLPSRPYTFTEALDRLPDSTNGLSSMIGWDAMHICDAIQTANANSLPLRLTVDEVVELRKWL